MKFETTADRIEKKVREGDGDLVLNALRVSLANNRMMSYTGEDELRDNLLRCSELLKERYLVRNLPAGSQSAEVQESD